MDGKNDFDSSGVPSGVLTRLLKMGLNNDRNIE
jgi:hypothetical protein